MSVTFSDVSFAYPGGVPILARVDLTVEPGEVVAVVGRSGAGKTTILKLVNRLLLPSSGTVRVQARDTRTWDAIALRRRTGYVFQDVGLCPHLTVSANAGILPRLEGWDDARARARVGELLEVPAGLAQLHPLEDGLAATGMAFVQQVWHLYVFALLVVRILRLGRQALDGGNVFGGYLAYGVGLTVYLLKKPTGDDRTFWVTNMYSPASSWATRIATFELCEPPGAPVIGSATPPVEEVIVTGSRIRRDTFSSAAPMEVVLTEAAAPRGITDVASLLQTTTVAAGAPQVTAASSSVFVENGGLGSSSLSIRGLGPNRTLILLNGRRAGPSGVQGGVSSFDLNAIPNGEVGYTRDGGFTVSDQGSLVTQGGYTVVPGIRIPDDAANVVISRTGMSIVSRQ